MPSPLRKIVKRENSLVGYERAETLECGHVYWMKRDAFLAQKRRCQSCAAAAAPDPRDERIAALESLLREARDSHLEPRGWVFPENYKTFLAAFVARIDAHLSAEPAPDLSGSAPRPEIGGVEQHGGAT